MKVSKDTQSVKSIRVRASDTKEAIFRPLGEEKDRVRASLQDEVASFTYAMKKDGDIEIDGTLYPTISNEKSDFVMAKRIVRKNTIKYFVKRNSYGKFLNPMGMYDEGRHNKQRHGTGEAEWPLTEVNENVFMMYINFLRTNNQSYLLNAERISI